MVSEKKNTNVWFEGDFGELSVCLEEFLMLGSNRKHEIQKLEMAF